MNVIQGRQLDGLCRWAIRERLETHEGEHTLFSLAFPLAADPIFNIGDRWLLARLS